jgi:uncharacterized protein DUF5615
MRFVADENVSRRVVERLQADGFDVTRFGGSLSGISDAEVLDSRGGSQSHFDYRRPGLR